MLFHVPNSIDKHNNYWLNVDAAIKISDGLPASHNGGWSSVDVLAPKQAPICSLVSSSLTDVPDCAPDVRDIKQWKTAEDRGRWYEPYLCGMNQRRVALRKNKLY